MSTDEKTVGEEKTAKTAKVNDAPNDAPNVDEAVAPVEEAPEKASEAASEEESEAASDEVVTHAFEGFVDAADASDARVPAIEMRGVNKHYGDLHVLRDINLKIAKGEVLVVVGPSGSGKSTLCRTMNRLETIDSGEILLFGEPLPQEGKALAAARAKIGMVFQSFNLFAHKTVLDNVTMGPVEVLGIPRKQAEEEAMELLRRVGVDSQAKKVPAQLSGGQQQRVAIARSLAMHPRAMLFDEPTSALDPEMINEVLDVMVELAREGMTMVVVTHEMNFARRVGDLVVFMADGAIVETAPPAEFFDHPKTDRAREFLNSIKGH